MLLNSNNLSFLAHLLGKKFVIYLVVSFRRFFFYSRISNVLWPAIYMNSTMLYCSTKLDSDTVENKTAALF